METAELQRTALHPFWKDGKMVRESILPVAENGEVAGFLRFLPKKILRVENSFLTETYREGADYTVQGKKIVFHGGRVPHLEEKHLRGIDLPDEIKDDPKKFNIVGCLYSDSPFILSRQVVVTYEFDAAECTFAPAGSAQEYLPKTLRKLQEGKDLAVLLYGDSISVGCNASKRMGVEPFQPAWYEMVLWALADKFGSKISFTNTSVGGMTSVWGAENTAERVEPYPSDLMIIAFGMNDGTMRLPVADFMANVRAMMAAQKNPDCEYLLISCIMPNPASGFLGYQKDYERELLEMRKEGVAVVDMTAMHEYLLQGKRYSDMTGNNINHPNDFLSACQAMNVLSLFGGVKE